MCRSSHLIASITPPSHPSLPSAANPRSALPIRPKQILSKPSTESPPPPGSRKHAPCTSLPDSSPLSFVGFAPALHHHHHQQQQKQHHQQQSSHKYAEERPAKRPMPTPGQTIAVVNSSGRQAASFIRVASAVGYHVRAQLRSLEGIVANEISSLPNVEVIVGDLYVKSSPRASASPTLGPSQVGVNHALIADLFQGAQLAFINTTFWGDEVAIGKALADEAVRANIQHYIFSTMPNHSLHDKDWPSLPLWSSKASIEAYIRTLPTLAPRTTYIYTGIYNNNFTSLPYPLFCMRLQPDGSFLWQAPFHPDVKLPWLDAEHDVGAAVLQLIKDGVSRWGNGERIALAYEMLSPREACRVFSRGVGRPVRYQRGEIEIKVKIPNGYRDQLAGLEKLYAQGAQHPTLQPPYFGDRKLEDSCPEEALALWEGYRGLEEYAREVFPLEEAANGLTWMNDDEESSHEGGGGEDAAAGDEGDADDADDDDEGLTIGGGAETPARKEEGWLA